MYTITVEEDSVRSYILSFALFFYFSLSRSLKFAFCFSLFLCFANLVFLVNSTIDFGQSLPVRPLELAAENSGKADLHLAMGSSLTVTPACNMPKRTAKKGGNLVIVNLQKTPLDHLATLRIFQKCDVVMKEVMKRLGRF